jgi:hypothetical protein
MSDLDRTEVEYWRDDGNPLPAAEDGHTIAKLRERVVELLRDRDTVREELALLKDKHRRLLYDVRRALGQAKGEFKGGKLKPPEVRT